MSFTLTNNSATAVVTDISTASSTYGTFSVSSGSFPLLSGQTITGTNTLISNLKGSPYGTIQLFIDQGDAQIEVYINSVLYSSLAYSSGIASIQVPILQVGDTIQINIDEADLPTPSMTPTPSVTASPTPTPTPTVTPTPSSTPALDNPISLGALWWIDYTDAATLTFDGSPGNQQVATATEKIANVVFTASTNQGPQYDPTGYLGVSGDVRTNAAALENNPADYPNVFSAWTFFTTFYDDQVSQNGGKIIRLNDPSAALEFGFMRDDGVGGVADWKFRAYSTGGSNSVTVSVNPILSAWTFVAVRAYQDGADIKLEVWENGSIVAQNTLASHTLYTSTSNQFKLMFDGGIDFATEHFFFDFKLSDANMTKAFAYLNNKY